MRKPQGNATLTAVAGLRVGHVEDQAARTGCTVVLCEAGAVAGVDQRGGAPATRETDLLRPLHLVERVHAVLLTGGSAFGLEAAGGVMRYLAGRGIGFETGVARVPIVPAAALFDLAVGRADVWPDAEMGYQACLKASDAAVAEGQVGAGCGCTVGKILGMDAAMPGGIGSAAVDLGEGLCVAALAAVNALGDVVDPASGRVVAGARQADGAFADTLSVMAGMTGAGPAGWVAPSNTVLVVVATNARLTKEQTNVLAQMAQDGLALAIRPAHTLFDGDTVFALATGEHTADVNVLGAFAAQVVAQAIVRAVRPAGATA